MVLNWGNIYLNTIFIKIIIKLNFYFLLYVKNILNIYIYIIKYCNK